MVRRKGRRAIARGWRRRRRLVEPPLEEKDAALVDPVAPERQQEVEPALYKREAHRRRQPRLEHAEPRAVVLPHREEARPAPRVGERGVGRHKQAHAGADRKGEQRVPAQVGIPGAFQAPSAIEHAAEAQPEIECLPAANAHEDDRRREVGACRVHKVDRRLPQRAREDGRGRQPQPCEQRSEQRRPVCRVKLTRFRL